MTPIRTSTTTMTHSANAGASRRLRARLAIPTVLAAGAALVGCGDDGGGAADATTATTATSQASPSGTAAEVELATLLNDPSQYDEQRVSTSGVANQLTPFVLALTPRDMTTGTGAPSASILPTSPFDSSPGETTSTTGSPTGDTDRLVVVYGRITAPDDGAMVTVTGTLQDSFDEAAIEQALGITLDDQVVQSLGLADQDVVLVADSVTAADGASTMTGMTITGSS